MMFKSHNCNASVFFSGTLGGDLIYLKKKKKKIIKVVFICEDCLPEQDG